MKYIVIVAFLVTQLVKAQDSVSVEITNWKDDKKASVVFTFDDWSPGHGSIVYPLFKKYNTPATFYVTLKSKDYSGGYETMKAAYADGFEIGNHTHNHNDLSKLDSAELHKEVTNAQEVLRKEVHPKCANTFAYPFGVFTTKVIKKTKATHIGARLANLSYGRMWRYSLTYGSTDYYQLQTFMARDIYTPDMYSRLTKSATKQGGMIVFMYHSIYNDSIDDHWFGAISEGLLEAHLKAVIKHNDSVWVTTFEKALMYHKEKAKASLSIQKVENRITMNIDNKLDSTQYFEELTIKVSGVEPGKVKLVKDNQTGKSIPFTPGNNPNEILFNTLPYNKEIIIEL